jgi:chromate transporter
LTRHPSLLDFVGSLLLVAATAFGGGLGAHYYHLMVERRNWLSREQFFQDMTLAQLLPGPNMVNIVSIIGNRLFGPIGAALGSIAVLLPGTLLLIVAASFIAQYRDVPEVQRVMRAVAAAATGLLAATIVRLAPGAKGARLNIPIVLIVAGLLILAKSPMLLVVAVVAPVAIWANRPGKP